MLTTSASTIRCLQLGMSWFPEQAGNGLDRVYYALSSNLPKVGVSVHGLVAGTDAVQRSSESRVMSFASDAAALPRRLLGLRTAVRRMLRTHPFDLVVSHFALYTAPVLDLIDGLPLVVHFHGPWAGESKAEGESRLTTGAKAAVERLVYRRATKFIVLSDAFRCVLHEHYGIPYDFIRIVPGGTDTARFDVALSREEARMALGWPTDRPILLSVRRLAHRMGLENLIDAMEMVRRHVPGALLLIAGKGPLKDDLNRRIASLGLQETVKLLGFVPEENLPIAFRAAEFSVVPTVALEGFGLITVESLAAGTPVLVTPNGGLPEVVRPLSCDLVLSGSGPHQMADRIVSVLNGTVRLPSAPDCRRYVHEHFDWTRVARQTRSVYEEVLS